MSVETYGRWPWVAAGMVVSSRVSAASAGLAFAGFPLAMKLRMRRAHA